MFSFLMSLLLLEVRSVGNTLKIKLNKHWRQWCIHCDYRRSTQQCSLTFYWLTTSTDIPQIKAFVNKKWRLVRGVRQDPNYTRFELNGTNLGLIKISFCIFLPIEPNCTEYWFLKFQMCPITESKCPKLILKSPRFVPFGANLGNSWTSVTPWGWSCAGISNLPSKLGQIGPKGDKSGTF